MYKLNNYKKPLEDRELYIAAAAYLMSNGQTQEDVAAKLGLSQAEICRLKKEARDNGWLDKAPAFRVADDDVWKRSHERFFSTSEVYNWLRAGSPGGENLHRLTVLHLFPDGTINRSAARVILDLLGNARTVGVTWGNTISRLVEAFRDEVAATPPRDRRRGLGFVPLCGEPLGDGRDPSRFSSSALAAQLEGIFNGEITSERPPSIAGIQAFIPLKFKSAAQVATIRSFLCCVRGYSRVFGARDDTQGRSPRLVDDLDAILSSGGVVDPNGRGVFLKERIEAGDITEEELQRSVVGDIGGVIIPVKGIGNDDRNRIDQMNERWTGARLGDLKRCADAARKSGFDGAKPGVLLFAFRKKRLKLVLRCIEMGLVNELIVDQELERALTNMKKKSEASTVARANAVT